jgi:hypothetical protein
MRMNSWWCWRLVVVVVVVVVLTSALLAQARIYSLKIHSSSIDRPIRTTTIATAIAAEHHHIQTQNSKNKKKRRQLQSLEQIWDMSFFEHTIIETEEEPESDTVQILVNFVSSDRMNDDMVHVDILDPQNCSTFVLPLQDDEAAIANVLNEIFSINGPSSSDPIGQGWGFRNWTSTIRVYLPRNGILDTVSNVTTSPVFTTNGDGDDADNIDGVQFCVRVSLAMPPSDDDSISEMPITQVGLLVTVVVEEKDTNTTTPDGQQQQSVLSASVADFIFPTITLPPIPPEAYAAFCDSNYVEMDTQPLILEGDLVRICIFPPEGGNYTMLGVDFFQYQEIVNNNNNDDNDDGMANTTTTTVSNEEQPPATFQAAITQGGEPSMNQLTQYQCTPQLCVIESVLFAAFFEPNTAVWASGYATFRDGDRKIIASNETVEDEEMEPEILGSNVYLAFETLLQIVNTMPGETLPPTMAPTSLPSDLPSYMPSSVPSVAPKSGVSAVAFSHYCAGAGLSLVMCIVLLLQC